MSKKYNARNYYLIDSVKGGCGKTTFAIMLTQYLEKKKDNGMIEGEICLLDMDFLGTGMRQLFLGGNILGSFTEMVDELSCDSIYLNTKIRNFKVEDKRYIQKTKVGSYELHIGFSDPNHRVKGEYRFSSKNNYVPGIQYGEFRAGIKKIFEKGELEKQIDAGDNVVQSVILDMSPGSDAFSDSIKDCLLDRKHSEFIEEKDRCHYFLMVGMDASHLVAAMNYLHDLYEGEDLIPDKVYIVFNDILQGTYGDVEKTLYEARKDFFQNMLQNIPVEKQNKIRFLVLNPYSDYAKVVQNMAGICDADDDVFLSCPIRYYAEFGERLDEVIGQDMEEKVLKCLNE